MPSIFNTSNLEFKKDAAILDSFDLETLTPRLSKETKSENLIFDVRKLNPGKFSFP